MSEILALFGQMRWQDFVDIAVVAYVTYKVILLVRGTRAMQMLAGLGIILLMLGVSQRLELLTINWLISSFLSSIIIIIIIIFQSDIRRALARIGRKPLAGDEEGTRATLEEVVRAASNLAASRTGALIILERGIGLAEYMETGTRLDARVDRYLLVTLFQTGAPLHDGAVMISGRRISHAACVLPLTEKINLKRGLGTRHRAALGLSEQTDAVGVVVSEETGMISVAFSGRLTHHKDAASLHNHLLELFELRTKEKKGFLRRIFT